MKKIDNFTNLYNVNKTLRFRLIPMWQTAENFASSGILKEDETRAEDYQKVKGYIIDYHKAFIESVLSNMQEFDVIEYSKLYYIKNKSEKDNAKMLEIEKNLRATIVKGLTSVEDYKKMFAKDLITTLLPMTYGKNVEVAKQIDQFSKFTTYFTKFNDNMKNIYTAETKTCGIANRCITDNLPKFLDNNSVVENNHEAITMIFEYIAKDFGVSVEYLQNFFAIDNFKKLLAQSGIDEYNNFIGGFTKPNGEKIKGLNEHISEYNAQHKDKKPIPKLIRLYKQILSDRKSISFVLDKFQTDEELLLAVEEQAKLLLDKGITTIEHWLAGFANYELDKIYLSGDVNISFVSQKIKADWRFVQTQWEEEKLASTSEGKKKNFEKLQEALSKQWEKIVLSVDNIDKYLQGEFFVDWYMCYVNENIVQFKQSYENSKSLFANTNVGKLVADERRISMLKDLLDSMKTLKKSIHVFDYKSSSAEKDIKFYADFEDVVACFVELDRLYDKVRNYVTCKPFSTDKIKINFGNYQLLSGWSKSTEKAYGGVLFTNGNNYYLGILDKKHKKSFLNYQHENSNGWKKANYYLLDAKKDLPHVVFSAKRIDYYKPSKEILDIKEKGSFIQDSKYYNIADCQKMIAFYQECIQKNEEWKIYDFHLKKPEEYKSYNEFCEDVDRQGYKIELENISEEYLKQLVKEGKLYLYQIYSKDFSEKTKGKPNLHTMYFKMLFDEQNLQDVVYKLGGSAEIFYRKASLERKVTHPKNQPISNKNPYVKEVRPTATYVYDIIKDKRYTQDEMFLHFPININFKQGTPKSMKQELNKRVRECLKYDNDNYVIGIDRGERNLIYIVVINSKGEIVKQLSGNIIDDGKFVVDYHKLLDTREKARKESRQSWTSIESIKDLKDGYISQIVHLLYKLMIKYDAIIALEDLNIRFKNSRRKVEKAVYQFENMLINKLSYLVEKDKQNTANGGLLHAYQLTNPMMTKGKQNGFIFYVNPDWTSKIDPTTGFVDLLKPKYTSVEKSKEFISNIDDIKWNAEQGYFEWHIDYHKFGNGQSDFVGKWIICTYGERIVSRKNSMNKFEQVTIDLTQEFKALFDKFDIKINGDIKAQILSQTSAEFFKGMVALLKYMLQLRNGNKEDDYILSPVKNSNGEFFDSRRVTDGKLPVDADANGAYNIARKALWAIEQIKQAPNDSLDNLNLTINKQQWLQYAQQND